MGLLQRMRSATLGTQFNSNVVVVDSAGGPEDVRGKAQRLSTAGAQTASELSASRGATQKAGTSRSNMAGHAASSLNDGKNSGARSRPARSSAGSSSTSTSRASRASKTSSASQSASDRRGRRQTSSLPLPATTRRLRTSSPPPPTAIRQQEAAARLSRGAAAHSTAAALRRRSSPSPSPSLPSVYQERPITASAQPIDRPLPQSVLRPAGIPARPTMAAIRAGIRAAGESPCDWSPTKRPDPPSGQTMADSSAGRNRPRPMSPGPQRRQMEMNGTRPVAARVDAIEGHCEQASLVASPVSGRAATNAKLREEPQRRDSGGTHEVGTGASTDLSRGASPQPPDLRHTAVPHTHATPATAPYAEDAMRPHAASLLLPRSNGDQAVDLAKSMQPLRSTAGEVITSHHARLATDAPLQPAAGKADMTNASVVWYAAPSSQALPFPGAGVIAPQTPSPLPVVPMSKVSDADKAANSVIRNPLQESSSLRVSVGPTIPAAKLLLPAGKDGDLVQSDKDTDATAVAKGPDTPQAHTESPFAKLAAQAATDTSSAATSGSASKASTTTGVHSKQVSPPPPGPKPKKEAASAPLPAAPTRSLFGSCCLATPAVKGDAPPPVKQQSLANKEPLQGPPPRAPIRGGLSRRVSNSSVLSSPGSIDGSPVDGSMLNGVGRPALEHSMSISSYRSQRADRSQEGTVCTLSASSRLQPMSPELVLANFSGPVSQVEPSREERKMNRCSRHRRSSSATSVCSVESFHSTTSHQSHMSHHSHMSQQSASSRRSRRSRHNTTMNTADMQVKGFEHLNLKGDSRRPLRSALRQSASRSSLEGSECDSPSGYSDQAPLPAVPHATEPLASERCHSPASGVDVTRSSSITRSSSFISLRSLAEGTEDCAVKDGSAATGGSLRSFGSNSSLVSAPSNGSFVCNWHETAGIDRPLSAGCRSNGPGAADSVRMPSVAWSASSSEKDRRTPSPPPAHPSTPDSGQRLPRRSDSTELFADVDEAINSSPIRRSSPLRPIAVSPPPADIFNSGGSIGRSPGSQLQQMRHLREKVNVMRADTERSLAAVITLAADARARRSASPPPTEALTASPSRAVVYEGTRLQEQKAKLQRRLEQLSMQQMRLELRIKEAADCSSSPRSPARFSEDGMMRSPSASMRGALSPLSISPQLANGRAASVASPSESGTPKDFRRRVTFGSPSPPPASQPSLPLKEDDTYANVVDTVAGLRTMVGPEQPRSGSSKPVTGVGHTQGEDAAGHHTRRGLSGTMAHNSSVAAGRGLPPPLRPRSPSPGGSASSRQRHASSVASDSDGKTRRKSSRDPTRKLSPPGPDAGHPSTSSSRGNATSGLSAAPHPEGSRRRGYGSSGHSSSSATGSSSNGGGRGDTSRPSWVDDAVIRSGGRA